MQLENIKLKTKVALGLRVYSPYFAKWGVVMENMGGYLTVDFEDGTKGQSWAAGFQVGPGVQK